MRILWSLPRRRGRRQRPWGLLPVRAALRRTARGADPLLPDNDGRRHLSTQRHGRVPVRAYGEHRSLQVGRRGVDLMCRDDACTLRALHCYVRGLNVRLAPCPQTQTHLLSPLPSSLTSPAPTEPTLLPPLPCPACCPLSRGAPSNMVCPKPPATDCTFTACP